MAEIQEQQGKIHFVLSDLQLQLTFISSTEKDSAGLSSESNLQPDEIASSSSHPSQDDTDRSSTCSNNTDSSQDQDSRVEAQRLITDTTLRSHNDPTSLTLAGQLCNCLSKFFLGFSLKTEDPYMSKNSADTSGHQSETTSTWNQTLSPLHNYDHNVNRARCKVETRKAQPVGRKKKTVSAFIELDTGTESINLVSRRYLEKKLMFPEESITPLTYKEHKYPIICANGQPLALIGSVSLSFTIFELKDHVRLNHCEPHYENVTFHVTEAFNAPFDLLVGSTFIQEHNVYSRRSLLNSVSPPRESGGSSLIL